MLTWKGNADIIIFSGGENGQSIQIQHTTIHAEGLPGLYHHDALSNHPNMPAILTSKVEAEAEVEGDGP